MTILKELFRIDEKLWSGEIEPKWKPAMGFFSKDASEIAKGLKSASKDYAQASRRLNFYINRAGKKLSMEDKARLENAKMELKRQFGIRESVSMLEQKHNMDYNPINPATVAAINSVAREHLSKVTDKNTVNALLSLAYVKGFSAGQSQFETQAKKYLAGLATKESVKSAMDDAFAKGFSAGKSSWQK